MVCIGDWIFFVFFVIFGLIGVVVQLFNVYWLLKKYDIDFEVFIVGEYKCMLMVFGENIEKGWEKFQEDLEVIYELFKNFVVYYWL